MTRRRPNFGVPAIKQQIAGRPVVAVRVLSDSSPDVISHTLATLTNPVTVRGTIVLRLPGQLREKIRVGTRKKKSEPGSQ